MSVNRFKGFVERLPFIIIDLDNNSIDSYQLFLSGIRINALSQSEEMSEFQKVLHNFECRLNSLIEEDLRIKPENLSEFLPLLIEYFKFYINENISLEILKELPIEELDAFYNDLAKGMETYALSDKPNNLKDKKPNVVGESNPKTKAVSESNPKTNKQPIDEYVLNGKVIKNVQ